MKRGQIKYLVLSFAIFYSPSEDVLIFKQFQLHRQFILNFLFNLIFLLFSIARLNLMKETQHEKYNITFKFITVNYIRCQFHQHFTCMFFVQKSFPLITFWQKKHFRTKTARVKCWWNWPQNSKVILNII